MDNKSLLSRRQAAASLMAAAGAVAGVLVLPVSRSRAEEAHLSPADPKARAVGYLEDAAQVDARQYPAFARGQTCENCLQLQGAAGAPYRPCTLFPGKLVAAAGWCSGWTPEL
jgi:hypothetical protein